MTKFPEAQARLFQNRFVCRRCKTVIRASNLFVLQGKVRCKKCHSKSLRPLKK